MAPVADSSVGADPYAGCMPEPAPLHLRFLNYWPGMDKVPRPVNVFEISGFPRWETVASNVLAFFFDPNERHGLGTVFVDALLGLLDGARFVGPEGLAAEKFDSQLDLRSTEWTVVTEQATSDGMRIDIYLTNDELKLAIIIENKIDALVNNPFESYARHALLRYPRTLSVVLAPTHRVSTAPDDGAGWTSRSVIYDDLFDEAQAQPLSGDSRSMDLLHQFIENTSERRNRVDVEKEAALLANFWGAVEGNEKQFVEFFGELDRVNQVLKGRADRLRQAILGGLNSRGIPVDDKFVVAGIDHGWGRKAGLVATVYLGFHVHAGPGVELILGFNPVRHINELSVKAYEKHNKSNDCLVGYDHIPLGLPFTATDEAVAEKFLELVDRLLDPQS